ncbi:hypothetical protein SO802_014924 [Lithocarpus litseifolius]|uniref:Uncharacterized protein n=1 Tax=Lithocarpus litseifolius TaxID=425828 RepID=A0AAW2CSC0_9ROSI
MATPSAHSAPFTFIPSSSFASGVMLEAVMAQLKHMDARLDTLTIELYQVNTRVSRIARRLARMDEDATEMIKNTEENKKLAAEKEVEVREVLQQLNSKLLLIGNLVHDSVPVNNDEANNKVVRSWGEKRLEPKLKNHVDLVELFGIADLKKGMYYSFVDQLLGFTFLVWQLAFSTIIGRSYLFNQMAGCLLVDTDVVVAVAGSTCGSLIIVCIFHTCGGSNADQMLSGVDFMWPVLMIASSAFQAGASIIKEFVFTNAATHLKAFFVLFFLPFLSRVKGIPLGQLPSILKSGAGCFLNFGANVPGCDGAPLLPLLYIMINLAFNISVLNVVKISSAVVSSLTVMLSEDAFGYPGLLFGYAIYAFLIILLAKIALIRFTGTTTIFLQLQQVVKA